MRRYHIPFLIRICVSALVILAALPASSGTASQRVGNSYTSPATGFTIEWTNDWAMDNDDDVVIFLDRGDGLLVAVTGMDSRLLSPEDFVTTVPDSFELIEVFETDPYRALYVVVETGSHMLMQAYLSEDGETTLSVMMIFEPDTMDESIALVQNEIIIDGNPPFANNSSPASIGLGTAGTSRTDRGEERTQASPDESDEGPIRTKRSTAETDTPAEDGSFTGPVYGYTVTFDPEIWTKDVEIHEGNVDGVRLLRDDSTFTIWAWDVYGPDPVACLDAEADYYANDSENVADWEPALGADGQPLRYESETLAWGVYTFMYTNQLGETYQLVDYISCEPIPGQDAQLIVLLSAEPSAYNAELDLALDVLDTLAFSDIEAPAPTAVPEETAAPEETAVPEPTETPPDTGELVSTNLEGTVYTSPNYGFTADIPLEWQILEESTEGSEEWLVISNGTSEVTLWATDAYGGDLTGCVDFAANSSGLDLVIDTDASGADFRGTYRNEAFANFIYEEDGVTMTYFINCRMIGDTGGYLILIQDVPYDDFTSERRFRNDIEQSIEMP